MEATETTPNAPFNTGRNVPIFLANRWIRIDTAHNSHRDSERWSIIVEGVEVWSGENEDEFDKALELVTKTAERLGQLER